MLDMILNIIAAIGTPSVLVGFIYIGRKLQILDRIEKDVDILKNNVKVISDHLVKKDDDFNHSLLKTHSPLSLKPEGEQLIRELGVDKTFADHRTDFFRFISDEQPQTFYDVEIASIKSIWFLFDRSYFNSVKKYLYQRPELNKEHFLKFLGIYVRDRYIEETNFKEAE